MAWWLMPRTPDPEVGGSSPTRVKPCCVLEQGTFTPQKALVIPRKRWLRPNMTEKLFTGTLRINQPKPMLWVLREAILMSTRKISFYEEMTKIIFQLSSNRHFISSSDLYLILMSNFYKYQPCFPGYNLYFYPFSDLAGEY